MKVDQKLLDKVSSLARLELSAEEKEEFIPQLSDIINYVNKINELETDQVKPVEHIVDLHNVFRKDQVLNSLEVSKIEKIAPHFEDDKFIVPKVIDSLS